MNHDRVPVPQINTDPEIAEHPRGRRAVFVAAAVVTALAATGGYSALVRDGGESAKAPATPENTNAEAVAEELGQEFLDMYAASPEGNRSIEPAGNDDSELLKLTYQVDGPAEVNGQPVDATEYSVYIQVPDAGTTAEAGTVSAEDLSGVTVQVGHIANGSYIQTIPYAASVHKTQSEEGQGWTMDAQSTTDDIPWSVIGAFPGKVDPETAALGLIETVDQQNAVKQQMVDVMHMAGRNEPFTAVDRPY